MDISKWASVIVAIIGLGGGLLASRKRSSPRDQIKSDIEIYKALPDASASREKLRASIETQIDALIEREQQFRRDPSGMSLGVALALIGGGGSGLALSAGGLWDFFLILTLLVMLMGVFGFFESLRPVRRDDKGRAV